MDFDPGITGIASQPFWLHWHDEEQTFSSPWSRAGAWVREDVRSA
jgi:hypothetical protein